MAAHLHILGICGTFMGGLAALARQSGLRVTGCDAQVYAPMSEQLAALGIELIEGYGAAQIGLAPDLWVVGDDDIFTLPERVELHEAPLELLCEGYNEDDLYEHTIILHFDVLPEDPAGPKAQIGILEQLRQLFGL